MEKKFKRTTVTSALPYANGPVHIGHLAGVYVPADIYVRYLRLKKEDVIFIGGSDEHGVPITIRAKKEGITPQDVVDRYHTLIKKSFEEFGVSFDVYSRTTSKTHHDTASDFFRKLYDKGEFIEKTSMQYYDEEAKTFLADRYITGECPHCHAEGAYGDQCEKCGTSLSPTDLINPKSAISGSQPVMRETKHWYLPLDKHEEWLRQWILEDHKEWRPNVYGQCKSWLDMGLQPRAVSRDLDWGIPVPVEGAEGKVLYVWFDAPIGYISNTKELLPDTWEKWWKDPETRLVHFIGKDNIVFHCIVFPAMLKAEGSYILPDNVPSNEFLNLEGDKISTSRNWAVWLHEYLVDFPGKQDVLRYVLTANAPETKDNDFTWKDFQARNNNELVAVYGNFVNRALQLTKKYFDSVVPAAGELNDYDRETLKEFADVKAEVEKLLDVFKFRDAQKEAMNLARIGNKYLADTEPWKLAKTDMERVATILHISLQLVANLAIAFEPFLPFSSEKLRKMLNMDSFDWAELGHTDLLPAGHQLGTPELLFEKIEDDVIQAQVDKLLATKKANEAATYKANPIKPTIAFEDFEKLDIRVGTVLECEAVPKMKKLLKFKIADGLENRTIEVYLAGSDSPTQITLDAKGEAMQQAGVPVGIVARIACDGTQYEIGREESSQISLRIVDGKVAFREADDKGFIPVNTIAELKMIDLDNASRGRKYLQQGNIDLLDAEWTPISKLEGIYDGGNFTVARLRVSLGNGNAGLFAANGGTIRNVVIASASALRGQWHAGMVCGENTGTIERCTNRASVTDGGSNTLGGICGYNNNGTISECLNTGTLTIDATVPSDGTGGIVGYCGKGTITGCGNTGGIGGKPSKTGGIAGQADDCQIADCYNTGDLVLPWGAGDNNGGIAGLTYNATLITRCYNTGTVTVEGSQAGGICGQLNAGATISSCYNAGKVGAKWNSGGIAGQSTDAEIIACHNDGLIESQTSGWAGAGGICGFHKGTITACYHIGQVTGDSAIGAIVGEHNSGNISYCYWNGDLEGIPAGGGGSQTGNEKFGAAWPQPSTHEAWRTTAETPAAYWRTLGSAGGGYPKLAWEK